MKSSNSSVFPFAWISNSPMSWLNLARFRADIFLSWVTDVLGVLDVALVLVLLVDGLAVPNFLKEFK